MIYSVGEVVPKLLSFFLLPVYTYYLTPSDYGIISYTSALVVFIPIISTLGLNSFLLRFFYERHSKDAQLKLIGNIFVFVAMLSTIIFVLGYFFIPMLITELNLGIPWQPYLKLAFIAAYFDIFSLIPLVYFRLQKNARLFVILNLLKVFLQYGLILVLIVFFKMGILGYYYGNVIVLVPFLIYYFWLIWKESIINFNLPEILEGLRFSLPLLPGIFAYMVLSYSDRVLLERSVSLSELGVYNIAYTLAFSVNILITSVYRAIEPEIFQRYGTSGFESFIDRSKAVFFSFIYISAMVVALFSPEFFSVMTDESYRSGFIFVPCIMVGVIMSGQNVIYGGLLYAEKNTRAVGFATLVGVLVSLASNIFLIPRFGVYGAAFTVAISFLSMNLMLFLQLRGKLSLTQDFGALSIYLLFISSILLFTNEISILFIGLKTVLVLLYSLIILSIFNIRILRLMASIKWKGLSVENFFNGVRNSQ
jgi:O-antigen/teichoic acid export membrane protein